MTVYSDTYSDSYLDTYGVPSALPGYPDGSALDARLELQLNGKWTDFTAAAMPDGGAYGQVKSGQPDGAQQPVPSGMNAAWDNPGYSLSPRNSGSPYYPYIRQGTPARLSLASPYGTYLRLEGAAGSYAWCPEASRLDITGSMDVQVELRLSGSRLTRLAYKDDGAGSFCWELVLETDGTVALFWFDSGAVLRQAVSTVAFAVSVRALRAALNASTGTVTFYTAASIAGPWTQAGSAVSGTSGAATTLRTGSGTAPLSVGGNGGDTSHQLYGQVTAFRLYNGISGSGGTLAAEAAFSSQPEGTVEWTDSPGNLWQLAGDAEVSGRDYRLHGELSTANPSAHSSGGMPRLTAAVSGRLRRLQQAAAAPVDSPLYRAILAQSGSLAPVAYWPMEDGSSSQGFGPAVGATLLAVTSGTVKPAADTSFAASAALPLLNGAVLTAGVPSYTGGTAWAVRFPMKAGSVPSTAELVRIAVSGGACSTVIVTMPSTTTMRLYGLDGGGGTVFDTTATTRATSPSQPQWWSVEATVPSSGHVQYALVSVAPGAITGDSQSSTVTTGAGFGNVTGVTFNTGGILTDTVVGHVSVQKAWASMFTLGTPLNAYSGELAADRFYRVCTEQGIACRILGRPSVTQPPRASS